ncbi:GtrA family protein [Nocardioides alcanivorans]|uniref:GtrA family protein n=1 Tax=Nocardioides alcanivorans TaxID=2897352 RepID=UPI001F281C9F|nr:GtrA family protein [Nocardioides alcanivorans]
MVNTAIDMALFLLLQGWLGIVAANFVSTSAGMTFSFLVNGRFTFRAERPTLRAAGLFLATTGVTMWVLQPIVIHLLLEFLDTMWLVKFLAIGVSFVANFLAYRFVVWPVRHRKA